MGFHELIDMSYLLNPAQSQILQHVMTWGNIRLNEVSGDPFRGPPSPSRTSSQILTRASDRCLRYLDRIKRYEASLLTPLGIDLAELERDVASKDGPSFNQFIWGKRPPWLNGFTEITRVVLDDLWQIHQARTNVHERILRWKRTFGAQETIQSEVKIVGLPNQITWLQETYVRRVTFADSLTLTSRHGWDLVQAYYDPAERAAQNILDGAAALQHYLKIAAPST